MEKPQSQSIEVGTASLPKTNWEDIREPGAFVDLKTGELNRVLPQGLVAGASPAVVRQSRRPTRVAKVSDDPLVSTLEAQLTCAKHSIYFDF